MSVEPHIQCDVGADGSTEWCNSIDYPLGGLTTATEVRRSLARQGWHRRPDGRDICPKCWEAGER